MRCGIILAAALTATSVTAVSVTGAQADEWCGYAAQVNAIIQCGYSSITGCEDTIGKGATCFVNPDYALAIKRGTPATPVKFTPRRG